MGSQAEINVAEFLNIKRADDIHSEPSKSSVDNELNPCWQDIYDADCTMDSIFSARFVASEWIKELPCGSGMEVSRSSFCSFVVRSLARSFVQTRQTEEIEF